MKTFKAITVRRALENAGINPSAVEDAGLLNQLVCMPSSWGPFISSSEKADRGRLFCSCGTSPMLAEWSVAFSRQANGEYLQSRSTIVLGIDRRGRDNFLVLMLS